MARRSYPAGYRPIADDVPLKCNKCTRAKSTTAATKRVASPRPQSDAMDYRNPFSDVHRIDEGPASSEKATVTSNSAAALPNSRINPFGKAHQKLSRSLTVCRRSLLNVLPVKSARGENAAKTPATESVPSAEGLTYCALDGLKEPDFELFPGEARKHVSRSCSWSTVTSDGGKPSEVRKGKGGKRCMALRSPGIVL